LAKSTVFSLFSADRELLELSRKIRVEERNILELSSGNGVYVTKKGDWFC